MELCINDHIKVTLIFDHSGNAYFKYLNKIFDLNINSENILNCDVCNNFDLEKKININYGHLKLTSDMNSLKGKIQKDLSNSSDNDCEYDDEENSKNLCDNEINKYLYEDKEYAEYYDSDDDI